MPALLDRPPTQGWDMDKKDFGARLRQLRTEAGMSQGDVAKKAGVSQSHISQWESGIYAPSATDVPDLAAALGVEIAELFKPAVGTVPPPRRGRPPKPEGPPPKRGKKK